MVDGRPASGCCSARQRHEGADAEVHQQQPCAACRAMVRACLWSTAQQCRLQQPHIHLWPSVLLHTSLSRQRSVLGAPPRVHVQWMAAVCREDCSCNALAPGQTVADWAHSVSCEQSDWGEPPELLFCPRCLTVYLASHT